jgi:predicted MFS family arabinose efflux permease
MIVRHGTRVRAQNTKSGRAEGGAGHLEAPRFDLPRGALVVLGLLAAAGLIAEGALYDWSVLYLKQEVGTDAGTAALAYASFSAAMAAGRFAGDWVRGHLSPVALLRASGALGAMGMALSLWVQQPMVVLVGFALVGLGFANVVPVLFSAAGTTRCPEMS